MAEKSKSSKDGFVSKVVTDPANVPDTLLLSGWLADSSVPDHTRLYFDPQLSSYVEIPDDAILHTQDIGPEASPLGGSFVWIKKDAVLTHKTAAAQAKARFLEGPIAAQVAAAVPQPGGPIPPGGPSLAAPCVSVPAPLCTPPSHILPCPVTQFCHPTITQPCNLTHTPPCLITHVAPCPHTIAPPCHPTINPICPLTHTPPCVIHSQIAPCPVLTVNPPCPVTHIPPCGPLTHTPPCVIHSQNAPCPVLTVNPPCHVSVAAACLTVAVCITQATCPSIHIPCQSVPACPTFGPCVSIACGFPGGGGVINPVQ